MFEPSQREPIAKSPVSVILFAHALSTETADALKDWQTYLGGLGRTYEVFLIQETRPEVAASDTPQTDRSLTYDRAAGFRDVLNEAIRSAQNPLIVFCRCDKQYRPADLEELLKLIDQVDLVIGYRTGGQAPPWRVVLDIITVLFGRVVLGIPVGPRVCWLGSEGWGRRWIARWIFGVRVHDPECPFRLARRTIFQNIPIQSRGSFMQVEMLAKANHLTCLLAEAPVKWTPPPAETSDAIPFGEDAWMIFREPDFGDAAVPRAAPAESPPVAM